MKRNSRSNDSGTQLNIQYVQKYGARVYPYQQALPVAKQQDKTNKRKLEEDYYQDYKPANYDRAVKHYFEHSYRQKLISGEYRKLDMFGDVKELKGFGVGIYLYIQLFRRLGWIFLLFALLSVLPIVMNVMGTGMSKYSLSYGTYLITTSLGINIFNLGNYNTNLTTYDAYIQTGMHCLINIIFFVFFLFWKAHKYGEIESFQADNDVIHPKKFCVEMGGLPKKGVTNQQLQTFFQTFGPVYECSIVYDYRDKLKYFQQIDEIDEEIKEAQLEIRLGGGDLEDLQKLKETKHQMVKNINCMKISPHIMSAYVHFQYEKSKNQLLNYYSDHWMFDACTHNCMRVTCCCCIDEPGPQYLFRDTQLRVINDKVSDPEQINWESLDLEVCNKMFRVIFAIIIILVFIAVCSTLVSMCSIFISVNSTNCDGVTIPTLAQASNTTNQTQITCFCNSNLFDFSDPSIQQLCVQIFKKLYIQNGLQIAAAVISTVTNFIFTILSKKIIDFTKPRSYSSGLITKTLVLFIFLLLNTCILPLLIYADAFGFKIASYVSLIKLINPNIAFFNMDSFTYYSDFTNIWYRNVSPYFVNFLVLNLIIVWVSFAFHACWNNRRVQKLKEDEGKILQKNMNAQIASFQVDVVAQTAQLFLIVFISIMYSAGLPVMIILGALNIISRYISNKYLILRYSKRIEGLTEDFSALSVGIIPFSILLSCLFGMWMFTASSYIYNTAMNVHIPFLDQYSNVFELFPRLFYISYTLVLAAIILLYILLYNTIVRFFSWLGSLCYETKDNRPTRKIIPFSQATKTLNLLHSYNIHSNFKYKNMILNLERYLQDE